MPTKDKRSMLWPTRIALVLTLAMTGCSPSPPIDAAAHGYTVAAAEAFQVAADKDLAGPVSPLTAVNALYLVPGESLTVYGTAPAQLGAGMPASRVDIEVGDSGAIAPRHFVDGAMERQINGPGQVNWGPRVVVLSEQSGRARVRVHEPGAAARAVFGRRADWTRPSPSRVSSRVCPIPPTDNGVTVPLAAGERVATAH